MTEANPSGKTTGSDVSGVSIDDVVELGEQVTANVERVILDKPAVVEHTLIAMLAGGHVLLEDVPGTGKTMLARAFARSIDGEFTRIQFTPDLLPTDITGTDVYDQRTRSFEFRPGPIFGNVVLGDEINRAPPKTQSALLEGMEEEQVTVDGATRELPDPFTVIATENAVEPSRTYELPVAEMDRFMKRLEIGYPEAEADVVDRVIGGHPIDAIDPVVTPERLRAARRRVQDVSVREPIRTYVADLAAYTRDHAQLGVSPRGTIALARAGQARAAIAGREYVIPDDIKTEARPVLAHRIHREGGMVGEGGREIVDDALDRVALP